MTAERTPPDSGTPPSSFCPRCLRRSDPGAVGALVGLCYCAECDRYACRWCWQESAAGDCPFCGHVYAAPVPLARRRLAAVAVARPGLTPSLAAAAVVIAVGLLALTLGGAFGQTRGVDGATRTPTPTIVAGSADSPSAAASPAAIALPPGTKQPQTATRTDRPVAPRTVTAAPTARPVRTSVPTAKPAPTPKPTPAPTATPDPAPTPAPTCKTVPNMVGTTVQAARTAWKAAGFKGSFTPAHGQNDRIVLTQNQVAGACLAPTTKVVVTFS